MCFEPGRLEEVQIHVEAKLYDIDPPSVFVDAYPGVRPFGLRRGMNTDEVVEGLAKQGQQKRPGLPATQFIYAMVTCRCMFIFKQR